MSDLLGLGLAVFLLVVGVTHFVVPHYYERLVPPWLPGVRGWVWLSGAVEILLGAGLLLDATRSSAAWLATGLMAVYTATHVEALARARRDAERWLDRPGGGVGRVVVNLGYVLWAGAVAVNT